MTDRMKYAIGVVVLLVLASAWYAQSSGSDAPTAARRGPAVGAGGEEADADGAPEKKARRGKRIEAADIPVIVKAVAKPAPGETFDRVRSLFDYAQSPDELAQIKVAQDLMEAQRKEAQAKAEQAAKEAAERGRVAATEAAARAEEQQKADEEYRRLHPPKPVPPRFAYDYIGVVGPMKDPFAILRGPDQKLNYARSGDVIDKQFRQIKAYNYFDFSTRFNVNEHFDFTFTVTNLFDKKPPAVGNDIGSTAFNSGNTYPSTYDALGRRFAAGARVKF